MRRADLAGLNKTRNNREEYTARNTIGEFPNYSKRLAINHFSKNIWIARNSRCGKRIGGNFIQRNNDPSFPYRIGLYRHNSVMSGERIKLFLARNGSFSSGGGYLRTTAYERLRLVPLLYETKELLIDVAGLLR